MHKTLKAALLLVLFLGQNILVSNETSQKEYFDLIELYPNLVSPQGDASKGEIEIILDRGKIADIEKSTGRDVGVMKKDAYWLWVNDACLFPNGKEGVYGRILWIRSLQGAPAVAVMPILSDGRIALNCNYRHSTRSWEMELPAGLVNVGESLELAAQRETKEETGMIIDKVWLLGNMASDTGVETTIVPIFAAKVLSKGDQELEDSEAIEEIISLSVEEIQKAFKQGFHRISIRGEEREVNFRDPKLAFALTLYSQGTHD